MHTFEGENGTVIHHNSDLSGDVQIMLHTSSIEKMDEKVMMVSISGQDLIEFIARCYVIPKKIENLEDAENDELLGL